MVIWSEFEQVLSECGRVLRLRADVLWKAEAGAHGCGVFLVRLRSGDQSPPSACRPGVRLLLAWMWVGRWGG